MVIAAAVANLGMWAAAVATVLDSAGKAAVLTAAITGLFGLLNTALQTVILRQARRNAELAEQTSRRVGIVHETAREAADELVDVKKKVRGDRRTGREQRAPGRGGGRRKGDPPPPIR